MHSESINIFKIILILISGLWLIMLATLAQASCKGCLCPGNPCDLCPLPATVDMPLKPDESETCVRIREKVPPTSAQPGSNEYFPALDMSTMACISEGGDVLRNRNRSKEFPARAYCKPAIVPSKIKQ